MICYWVAFWPELIKFECATDGLPLELFSRCGWRLERFEDLLVYKNGRLLNVYTKDNIQPNLRRRFVQVAIRVHLLHIRASLLARLLE